MYYEVFDNFLTDEHANEIEKIFTGDLPKWRYSDSIAYDDKTDYSFYFQYTTIFLLY